MSNARTIKRMLAFGFVGMLSIGLTAACGGSSDQGTSSGASRAGSQQEKPAESSSRLGLDSIRNDPCQLVTHAEAEGIFGRGADTPVKGRAVGTVEASCFYSVETQSLKGSELASAPSATVNLMFSPDRATGGMSGKVYMENARTDVSAQPVTGLGDDAFCAQADPAFPANQIFVRAGDVVLAVVSTDCASAQQFAAKALGRL